MGMTEEDLRGIGGIVTAAELRKAGFSAADEGPAVRPQGAAPLGAIRNPGAAFPQARRALRWGRTVLDSNQYVC
jgi:hypothetical protein